MSSGRPAAVDVADDRDPAGDRLAARDEWLVADGASQGDGSRHLCHSHLAAAFTLPRDRPRSPHRLSALAPRRSRVRNSMPRACCSSVFTATKLMVGRDAASQHAPDYDPGIASASAASVF